MSLAAEIFRNEFFKVGTMQGHHAYVLAVKAIFLWMVQAVMNPYCRIPTRPLMLAPTQLRIDRVQQRSLTDCYIGISSDLIVLNRVKKKIAKPRFDSSSFGGEG